MRASITPPGSLKARLCVEGRDRLYAYAGERGVPFLNCGKPIVAASAREAQALEELSRRSAANDAGLSAINGDDARRLEPELSAEACAALLSPRTGIIDGRALMLALQGDLEIFVEKRFGDAFTIRAVGSNLLDGTKDEDFNKFNTVADQENRVFDEFEIESERAGPVFQVIARYAF